MELDLWNEDFELAREWGMEIPIVQTGGQFGDLKSTSRQVGDDSLCFQPQGATLKDEEAFENGFQLDDHWMESDLGSLLHTLGDASSQLLPFDETCVSEVSTDSSLGLKESLYTVIPAHSHSNAQKFVKEQPTIHYATKVEFDALLSPNSPEQVAPDMKFENVTPTTSHMTVISPDSLFASEDFEFTELDFISFKDKADSVDLIVDDGDFMGLPISVEAVESTISFSGPSSPESISPSVTESSQDIYASSPEHSIDTSHSSIIESSPELYKVISLPSTPKRPTPYSRSSKSSAVKSSSSVKAPRRTRAPAQPVPEHIIMGNVDKKDRKKLQNKNAAIRYRMKKKEESLGIKSEEQELEEYNETLKSKVDDLQREIKYMRNLMEDVCKAKGITLQ